MKPKPVDGKLMVCSIDLKENLSERPVSRQLLASILKYMNSNSFNPEIKVEMDKVEDLMRN